MASLLIEIKSQQVLPRCDEVEGELDDPRQELVRRLLEYKKYRDAASILEERGRSWQQHYPRLSTDLPRPRARPGRRADPRGRAVGSGQRVRADHARDRRRAAVEHRLRRHADPRLHEPHPRPAAANPASFRSTTSSSRACTNPRWSESSWPFWSWCAITAIRVEQNALFGEIWILPNLECNAPLDLSNVDEYEHAGNSGQSAVGSRQ